MSMRAVVHDRYGAPEEVLKSRRIDRPQIGRDEVLVRVHAAGLHVGDCFGVRGSPWPLRMVSGLRRPRYGVPGLDVAGQVEAVGSKVSRFQPGDQVLGVCSWPRAGACADRPRGRDRRRWQRRRPAERRSEEAEQMMSTLTGPLLAEGAPTVTRRGLHCDLPNRARGGGSYRGPARGEPRNHAGAQARASRTFSPSGIDTMRRWSPT